MSAGGRVRAGWAVRVAAAALCLVSATTLARPSAGDDVLAAPATSSYVPVGPLRLADTRQAECGCRRLDASTIAVAVGGRAGVPAGAVAAAITVTATRSTGGGYVTVHPAGRPRPEASVLNLVAGRDTANSTIVPIGAGGEIEVYVSAPSDLVVDVTGVFVATDRARAGRFVPMPPVRVADTRSSGAALRPGGSITVPLPAGVPADAVALAVNVTSVDARVPGYLAGYPAGGSASTSFANPDGSGTARAAALILPVSPRGLTIGGTAGGHVIVDVTGWFTGPSAEESADGLFVAVAPTRVLDTRHGRERIWAAGTVELALPDPRAAAVVTNLTLDRTDDAGYVTAWPAGTRRPATSSLNAPTRGSTVANLAITPASRRGTAYFAERGTDAIVDLSGWFTGEPVASPLPPAPNVRPPSRVLLVGDSTMAAIRFVPGSQAALAGIDPVVDTEPCRRLVFPSCLSNTTFRVPNTAYEAITGTPGWVDVVVVMTGYNDWFDDFDAAFATIVGAARAKGARAVIWLTYVEGGDSPTALRAYRQNNADLWRVASGAAFPDVTVADWNAYQRLDPSWVGPDGIHLSTVGAYGLADYLARWAAHVEGRPCPAPTAPGGPVTDPCPRPDDAIAAPDVRSLYGV